MKKIILFLVGALVLGSVGYALLNAFITTTTTGLPTENISFTQNAGRCYQEISNQSTFCGGLNTGSYSCGGDFGSPNCLAALIDGDYSTSVTTSAESSATFNAAYGIPLQATGAIWQIQYLSNATLVNYSLPAPCFDETNINLRVSTTTNSIGGGTITGACLDGSNYLQLFTFTGSTADARLYEEAIFWNFTNNISRYIQLPLYGLVGNASISLSFPLEQYPDSNPSSLPLAYLFRFNDTPGPNMATNYADLQRNMTLSAGASFSSGLFGQGLYLNSSKNGYGEIPHTNLTNNFTFMFYVSLVNNTQAMHFIRYKGSTAAGMELTTSNFGGGNRFIRVQLSYPNNSLSCELGYTTNNIADGQFHHVAFGKNNTDFLLAYDGEIVNRSINCARDVIENYYPRASAVGGTQKLFLGSDAGSSAFVNGTFDEFIMFNSSLSDALIRNISPIVSNPYVILGNTTFFNHSLGRTSSANITLNVSILNNLLSNQCNCANCTLSGYTCTIPLTFHSDTFGKIQFSNLKINYSYGIDLCSASVNYTILNLSYYDQYTLSPVSATNSYDLLVGSPFLQEITGSLTSLSTHSFCTNVNLTQRNVNYSLHGSFLIENPLYSPIIIENGPSNPYVVATNPYYPLNIYLTDLGNDTSTSFLIKDIFSKQVLSNVQVLIYLHNNGSYLLANSKLSDITGTVQFNYLPNRDYHFVLSKEGYNTYTFDLNPIISSSYEVFMTATTTLNYTTTYDRISLFYSPTVYYANRTNVFSLTIASPLNELTSYSYLLTYPGGTSNSSGSSPGGSTLTSSFNITKAVMFDQVRLDYTYTSTIGGTKSSTLYFDIIITAGNYTLAANRDRTYGLGLFERLLIAVGIVVLVAGLASLIGQPIPGMVLGLSLFGYFVYTSFIPIWSVLISMLVGLILLSARSQ
jgi:hypothetical protein